MVDSDDDREGSSDPGIDLTGFLFGNIDESGRLENDVLDNESKRHLASLSRLGLSSILKEVIDVEQVNVKSESDSEEDGERESHPQQETSESARDDSNYMPNTIEAHAVLFSHKGFPVLCCMKYQAD
jgi:transcription initiation factor TFIID subunit 1